jgi:hypothetical protein
MALFLRQLSFATLTLIGFLVSITACDKDNGPALLAITSPASRSEVSGAVAVQVNVAENAGDVTVRVYARGVGSKNEGRLIGTAVTKQAVVQWDTKSFPSATSLEIYAVAQDKDGKTSISDPVQVKVQNAGAPSLSYLIAFTIPPKPVSASSVADVLPQNTPFTNTLAPSQFTIESSSNYALETLAARDTIGEWAWTPVTNMIGYGIKLSTKDMAGDFTEVGKPAATTASSALQKYSKTLEANPGDTVYGALSSYGSGSSESVLSNADSATFLAPHSASSPSEGEMITGLSNFSWPTLAGKGGYLYYVYDKNPWAKDAKLVCTNYPNATEKTTVSIAEKCASLSSGTYYWWVAAVSFNKLDKPDAFSYSDPRSFVKP